MADLRVESTITAPTKMAEGHVTSLIEEMRKTGSLTIEEKAERLEEIVQEAAQETRL